jgi:hypothetical protein
MADIREAILLRLLAIGTAMAQAPVSLFVSASRNRGLQDNDERPCFVLLDGTESARLTSEHRGRGGPRGIGPQLMTMRPEIYFLLKDHRPKNVDESGENVGTLLNAMRFSFLGLLEMDAQLQTLVGANGEIALSSTDTDMKSEAPGLGQMRLDLSITYVLDPTRQGGS